MPTHGRHLGLAALLLPLLAACATPGPRYDPAAFRGAVTARVPGLPEQSVAMLFEVPPEAIEVARRVTTPGRTDLERVNLLARSLFDPSAFGLRYDPTVTSTAAETLAQKRGNCVGMTSAFVGLGRALGLDVRYIDASREVTETRATGKGPAVTAGHLTAMVVADGRRVGLDVTRDGTFVGYQPLDDLAALAHYYNNRGFEEVAPALEAGEAADWAEAERLFLLSVQVEPRFARGWSNYGLAIARRGDRPRAIATYQRAIRLDPRLAAPRVNLGALLLDGGEVEAAIEALEGAAAIEPVGAHVHILLARARLRAGDEAGARFSLRRAQAIQPDHPALRQLLETLEPGRAAGRRQ